MLHAATAAVGGFANVKDKGVLGIGRAVHEFYFVRADLAQSGFNVVFSPVVPMNDDVNARSEIGQGEFLEFRNLDRAIGEDIEAGSVQGNRMAASTGWRTAHRRGRGDLPTRRDVFKRDRALLFPAIRDVEK